MACPCGRGSGGSGRAATSGAGSSSITRRMRRVSRCGRRSATRRAEWRSFTSTSRVLRVPSDLYATVAACGSATCTAPPATRAVPAAAADNFARAILIDIACFSSSHPVSRPRPERARRGSFTAVTETYRRPRGNGEQPVSPWRKALFRPARAGPGSCVPHWNRNRRPGQKGLTPRCRAGRYLGRSNRPPCGELGESARGSGMGGDRPRCAQPRSFRQRPRAVRAIRPSWMR